MPPRHGKSELCSVRFPAWFLGRNPDKRIVIASYAADLAERFSRQARGVVMGERFAAVFPGVTVAQDSKSVSAWDLAGHRGGLKAVGVGGPLTGHGADVLLIDDPVKNRQDANSEVYRQSTWDWYTSTAYTRLEDGGAVVLIMTRWHKDDLMGRLIAQMEAGEGDQWEIVHFPALSDSGEALWPEKYDLDALAGIRATIGPYDWEALYQGRPTPREGAMFHVAMFPVEEHAPAVQREWRAWDMGSTSAGGDYTVGVRMGIDADGRYWITDVVRGQWATDERNRIIRQTAELDGQAVRVHGPQDPGAAGKDAALAFSRLLAGFNVKTEPVSGDKSVRADPFSAQANAGNVSLVRAPWNRPFLDELSTFPLGMHDDQVDAASDAFNEINSRRVARIGTA